MLSQILRAAALTLAATGAIVSYAAAGGSGLDVTAVTSRALVQSLHGGAPGAPDTEPGGDLIALVNDCVAKYKALNTGAQPSEDAIHAVSEACHRAIEASGLTADQFWAKVGPLVERKGDPTASPPSKAPAAAPDEIEALVKRCAELYNALPKPGASDDQIAAVMEACNRAISASGLTKDEFFARYGRLFEKAEHNQPEHNQPDQKRAEPTPITSPDVAKLIDYCFAKHAALPALWDRDHPTDEEVHAVKEICQRAIDASGLSPDEFRALYMRKAGANADAATKTETDAKPRTDLKTPTTKVATATPKR